MGGGRSREGMGKHKDLWTKKWLVLHMALLPTAALLNRIGFEAADLDFTIYCQSN